MRRIVATLLGVVLIAGIALAIVRRPQLPPAERGRRLAERTGCFGCHGPGGAAGAQNPGRLDKSVPNFQDDVMMYAKTRDEVREWIRDGVTRRKAASVTWQAEHKRGVLAMPAFKSRLGAGQVDDLVAYVMAASGMREPDDSLATRGYVRADSLGCVGCHGPGGRLARTNPGSWKGYVPSWDGADFPEVVRDSTEFRQWVQHGVSQRFAANRVASYFLHRAVLKMPAYEDHLAPGDIPALWAYVTWLRAEGSRASAAPVEEHSHE